MSASEKMLIELGDVVQIVAPSNTQINDKIYIIDYIDDDIIKLINVENLTGYSLNIRDGSLTDESITGINILDRPEVSGYAAKKSSEFDTKVSICNGMFPVLSTETCRIEEAPTAVGSKTKVSSKTKIVLYL